MWSTELNILLNVAIAAILSGFVGIERERKNKPAGLRTHMMVGSVASLLVSIGYSLVPMFSSAYGENIKADPMRIIEAVIVGVSFIGSGTVLKRPKEGIVEYLSTAASIWFAAGIGMAVGAKLYVLSVGLTALILVINYPLRMLEKKLFTNEEEPQEE